MAEDNKPFYLNVKRDFYPLEVLSLLTAKKQKSAGSIAWRFLQKR